MSDDDLDTLLGKVRSELARTKGVDEKGRRLLRALNEDIETLLERTDGGEDDSLLERLQDSIDHFGVSHPALTSALSNLMTALSNAGI